VKGGLPSRRIEESIANLDGGAASGGLCDTARTPSVYKRTTWAAKVSSADNN